LADLFIVGVAPIDYSPILLLKPFGFRIAPDTHYTGEGAIIFKHAWRTPAVAREAEEKWGRSR
jgi:hypothetical protein